MNAYKQLTALSRETALLEGVIQHLGWDEETYMPPSASGIRGEQIERLTAQAHKEATSKTFKRALMEAEKERDSLNPKEQAALKRYQRDFEINTAQPTSFVSTFAALTSKAMHIWREARKKSDFSLFLPYFEKIVEMSRKKVDYLGFKEHPYDALLDLFEPEMTTKTCDEIFTPIEEKVSLLIRSAPNIDDSFLFTHFDKEKQFAFAEELLTAFNFDRNCGRLDLSTHPFSSSSHPTDSRITTRIDENDPMSNIFSTLHEMGHAFYAMGLPKEHFGTPLGDSVSMGIHESQSRFYEVFIGKSLPFWKGYYKKLQQTFPQQLKNISLEKFHQALHKITPSKIRVEADDTTYPLHIILRFTIEKKLIEGSLKPKEVPDLWNALMQKHLGITPKNDAEGLLQDIHWSMGCFGYFPTYLLGTAYAAQLFDTFKETYPDWETSCEAKNYTFIKEFLRKNIYQYGRQYLSLELIEKITGKPFSARPLLNFFEEKQTLF